MGRERRPPLKDQAEGERQLDIAAVAAAMEEEQIGVFWGAAVDWKAERPATLFGREKRNLAMGLWAPRWTTRAAGGRNFF